MPGGVEGDSIRVPPDGIIHERTRLQIVTYLATARDKRIPFTQIREDLDLTAGNLSVHLRRLEEAGYATIHKSIRERRTHTQVSLTSDGLEALRRYVEEMEEVLRVARDAVLDAPEKGEVRDDRS
ncbi:MAG: transcriptional regulator [Bacillota bacterium]